MPSGVDPMRAAARIAARHVRLASLKARSWLVVDSGSGLSGAARPATHGDESSSLTW